MLQYLVLPGDDANLENGLCQVDSDDTNISHVDAPHIWGASISSTMLTQRVLGALYCLNTHPDARIYSIDIRSR